MTAVLSLFGVVLLAVIAGLVITRRMESRMRYGHMSVANDGRGNLRSTITIERAISMVHAQGDTELETRLFSPGSG